MPGGGATWRIAPPPFTACRGGRHFPGLSEHIVSFLFPIVDSEALVLFFLWGFLPFLSEIRVQTDVEGRGDPAVRKNP